MTHDMVCQPGVYTLCHASTEACMPSRLPGKQCIIWSLEENLLPATALLSHPAKVGLAEEHSNSNSPCQSSQQLPSAFPAPSLPHLCLLEVLEEGQLLRHEQQQGATLAVLPTSGTPHSVDVLTRVIRGVVLDDPVNSCGRSRFRAYKSPSAPPYNYFLTCGINTRIALRGKSFPYHMKQLLPLLAESGCTCGRAGHSDTAPTYLGYPALWQPRLYTAGCPSLQSRTRRRWWCAAAASACRGCPAGREGVPGQDHTARDQAAADWLARRACASNRPLIDCMNNISKGCTFHHSIQATSANTTTQPDQRTSCTATLGTLCSEH
jgi:hypothetical protein